MSEPYVLEDLGEGRFRLHGEFNFETARELLRESQAAFEEHNVITLDLSQVTDSDSAGLALMIEWVRWAKRDVREIRFENVPKQVFAIADISEVSGVLEAGERWTGPPAPV